MAKALITVWNSYTEYDSPEAYERFVIEDTREQREALINKYTYNYGDVRDNVEDFFNGNIDSVYIESKPHVLYDLVGRYVFVTSKEDALTEEKIKYETNVEEIEKLFNNEIVII